MNLQQIKDDLDKEVIVCRATIVKAIEYALILEAARATPAQPVHDASEQADIAKRLRRVAKAAGVPVDSDDTFVYGVAFTLLGQIAYALESKPSPSSVGDAIRAMPLPEKWPDYTGADYSASQIRVLLSEAAALAEQRGNEDTILLDWFDRQRTAYGFEGVQEGNEWLMNGPFATLRQALRECMAAAEIERAAHQSKGV